LARQQGLNSDQVHDLVYVNTGKKSVKDLKGQEANAIIEHLIRGGAQFKGKKKTRVSLPWNVVELASQKQREFIETLAGELGWMDDPARLRGFIKRAVKRDRVITRQDGIKVIEGLKNILKRTGEGKSPSRARKSL
jgi:hypothetical protein